MTATPRPPMPLYRAADIRDILDNIREDWHRDVIDAAQRHGRKVVSKGRGPGSLEPEETAGLDYTVLDGGGVRDNLPWLWHLYQDLAPDVWRAVGEEVAPSPHLPSCINVNLLRGKGARYEAHTDAQPYTLLLFVTSHYPSEGGRLILGDEKQEIGIPPRSGHAVIFDGAAVPHRVEPLTRSGIRVTVPMVYLPKRIGARPEGLDSHLYAGGSRGEA